MINCLQFCINFAFSFNLRRYTMVGLLSLLIAEKFTSGALLNF